MNTDLRLRRHRLRAALSLVEVSLAAAVLMVTSVGVFSSLTRMQQTAITNRALTNADNLLRNSIEQALTRGWDDEANPLDILTPTIAGNTAPYNASADVTDGNWKQWDLYHGADAALFSDPIVPIYEDVNDLTKNVPARIYRKVQRVPGSNKLLWITFRAEYRIRGKLIAQEMWATRASD